MKKIVTMFVMMMALIAVSCAADTGSDDDGDDGVSRKEVTVSGYTFPKTGTLTTMTGDSTVTGTELATGFKTEADKVYTEAGTTTTAVTVTKQGETTDFTTELVIGKYTITYTAKTGEKYVYTLDAQAAPGGGDVPLTAMDLTITTSELSTAGVTLATIKTAIGTGATVNGGGDVTVTSGDLELIAGTTLALTVADATLSTDAAITYDQATLMTEITTLLNDYDISNDKVTISAPVDISSDGDKILTITADITATDSAVNSVPANLNKFTITLTIATGGANQDVWTTATM